MIYIEGNRRYIKPYVCPKCERGCPEARSIAIGGELVVSYRCKSCNAQVKLLTDEWAVRNADYKRKRDELCKYFGTSEEGEKISELERAFGKDMVSIDPLVPWYKIEAITTVGGESFEKVTPKSEHLYKKLKASRVVALFEDDKAVIDVFEGKYNLVREEKFDEEKKKKRIALIITLISVALIVALAVGALLTMHFTKRLLSDADSGIEIEIDGEDFSIFDKFSLELSVDEMGEDSPEYSVATSLLHEVSEKYKIYDILITKSGREIAPDGYVTVSMPLPENFRKENVSIYYIAPDGSYEKLETTVLAAENKVSFKTNHFSLYAFVEAPYTVDFDSAGGSLIDSQKVLWGQKVETPEVPTKKGYTFDKWLNSSDNTAWNFEKSVITHDTSLVASWSANDYVVTFDPNGGKLDTTTLRVSFGEEFTLPTPTRRGSTFAGWMLDGKPLTDGVWDIDSDVTLTAEWQINTYELYLYSSGAVYKQVSLLFGESLALDFIPSIEGYSFAGWYTEPELINLVENIVMPDGDVNLYARLLPNSYRVSFNSMGGSAVNEAITVTYDDTYGNLPVPTLVGRTFVGWSLDGEIISADTVIKTARNHELSAVWSANSYNVTFDLGDSEVTQARIYGEPYGVFPKVERAGYTLVGWFIGDTEIREDTLLELAKNHRVTARFEANTYRVRFESNGEVVEREVVYDSPYGELPLPTFKGHTLVSWQLDGKDISAKTVCKTANDHTVVAKWNVNTYTVTFDASGGTLGETAMKINYGEKYGSLPRPEREGYRFSKWLLDGVEIGYSDICETDSDHTLVAVWNPVLYTATLDPAGGECLRDSMYVYYDDKYDNLFSYPLSYTPSRDGFVFVGWSLDGELITSDTICKTPSNHTLVAVWQSKTYKVTFRYGDESVTYDITYGTPYTNIPSFVKTGHTLVGWTLDGVAVDVSAPCTTVGDHTLDAQFEANTYKVTLDPRGGSIENTVIEVKYGERYDALLTPEKSGYDFICWSLNGSVFTKDTVCEIASDHTLSAEWMKNEYNITWDLNGGSVSTALPSTYKVGQGIDGFITPSRSGMLFVGWYKVVGNTETRVDSISATDTGDVTLKARWYKNSAVTLQTVWEKSMKTSSKEGYASNVSDAIIVDVPDELKHYAEKGLLGITINVKFTVKVRSSGNATGTVTAKLKINGTDYNVVSKSMKGGGYSYWNGFWTVPCEGDWGSNSDTYSHSLEFSGTDPIKIGYRYDMKSDKTNDDVTTDIYYICNSISYEFYIK